VKKAAVLVLFTVALAAAVLVATERARSMEAFDRTPPVGYISLPAAVTTDHVTVLAAIAYPDAEAVELRLSNDGASWSGWEGYPSPSADGAVRLPWRLTAGAGAKTVTVEARNGAGAISTFTAHTTLRAARPAHRTRSGTSSN
jgi:hypothetical protein